MRTTWLARVMRNPGSKLGVRGGSFARLLVGRPGIARQQVPLAHHVSRGRASDGTTCVAKKSPLFKRLSAGNGFRTLGLDDPGTEIASAHGRVEASAPGPLVAARFRCPGRGEWILPWRGVENANDRRPCRPWRQFVRGELSSGIWRVARKSAPARITCSAASVAAARSSPAMIARRMPAVLVPTAGLTHRIGRREQHRGSLAQPLQRSASTRLRPAAASSWWNCWLRSDSTS